MSRNIKYLFLLLGVTITILVGFKQVQPNEAQQHMLIIIEGGGKKMRIHISQDGGYYEQEKIVAENKFDYTQVLLLLGKYEKEGWQIKESNFTKSTAPDPGFTADHFNVLYFRLGK